MASEWSTTVDIITSLIDNQSRYNHYNYIFVQVSTLPCHFKVAFYCSVTADGRFRPQLLLASKFGLFLHSGPTGFGCEGFIRLCPLAKKFENSTKRSNAAYQALLFIWKWKLFKLNNFVVTQQFNVQRSSLLQRGKSVKLKWCIVESKWHCLDERPTQSVCINENVKRLRKLYAADTFEVLYLDTSTTQSVELVIQNFTSLQFLFCRQLENSCDNICWKVSPLYRC